MNQVNAVIAHRAFAFGKDEIELQLREVLPDPLGDHFVVIAGRRFPPKQVISLVTGLDRSDFNSHQARNILCRLGFTAGRRSRERQPDVPARPGPHHGREADLLRPYVGRWVAQKGLEVLVAADTPHAVLEWLERHGQVADSMFMVPASDADVTGAAPT